jgi:hypothetical protein
LGISKGYFHDNSNKNNIMEVIEIIKIESKKLYEETSVYVSTVIKPATCIYLEEWGCPAAGETVIEITGVCNLEFSNIADYKTTVKKLIPRLMNKFNQSTITLEFFDCELYYIKK